MGAEQSGQFSPRLATITPKVASVENGSVTWADTAGTNSMLFIGGSVADGNATQGGSGKGVSRQWCGRSGTKAGDLHGVKADIANCRTRFVPAYQKRGLLGWVKYLDKPASQLGKEEVMQSLKELFQRDDGDIKQVYYSGHGTAYEGNWCFENAEGEVCEYVTLEEVMDLWQKHSPDPQSQYLWLVLDCCFSGAWVKKAKQENMLVTVCASCCEDEVSKEDELGGYFLKDWLDAKVNNHVEWELFEFNCSGERDPKAKSYGGEQHPICWSPDCHWWLRV